MRPPDFDGAAHDHNPAQYLMLDASFVGSVARINQIAATLDTTSGERAIVSAWKWISSNLHSERNQPQDYEWRTATATIDRGRFFGCAEHALVLGCLLRACDVPTIWVKALDVPWMEQYLDGGKFGGGQGHVYLEVIVDGKWALLDGNDPCLYQPYDWNQRLLPGKVNGRDVERLAYDKGGNPKELVLSLDWKPWNVQTRAFLDSFDRSLIALSKTAVYNRGRVLT